VISPNVPEIGFKSAAVIGPYELVIFAFPVYAENTLYLTEKYLPTSLAVVVYVLKKLDVPTQPVACVQYSQRSMYMPVGAVGA
jgi:hypothetical protein